MSDTTHAPVDELRRAFRPGMTSGQAMVWVWGAAIGLGVWALGFVGAVALNSEASPRVGAAAWLGWTVLALAVPGVGVLRPGGARGPVILRVLPTVLLLLAAVAVMVDKGASLGIPRTTRDGFLVLWTLASPLTAATLAWAAFTGRSTARSVLLAAGAPLSWIVVVAALWGASHTSAWHVVSLILTAVALVALVLARPKRGGLSAEGWVEAQAADGVLRAGDEAWPMPEAFANYRGVVSVPRDALPPQSPGRGARPPNPAELFPCTRAQVPWILRDLLDARLALVLYFSTAAAIAALIAAV
jgi:hypothetical protein